MPAATYSCPLCGWRFHLFYYQDNNRAYRQCERCSLVFVEPQYHLSPMLEKAEYDLHENSPEDLAYRKFLSRLCQPLLALIGPGDQGLDFGCGPGPTLSVIMAEAGFTMNLYDIFYYKNPQALNQTYDFITATEVVEHLFQPGKLFSQLWGLLPVTGVLGLMTKLLSDVSSFSSWHYKNDLTHVCFYSRECFEYLAQSLNAQLTIIGDDVIILVKQA